MNTRSMPGIALTFMMALVMSAPASAERGWGWRGGVYIDAPHWRQWHQGRWRHGWHDGRFGWWWVAGTLWYFYPRPVYPYPDPYIPPDVVVIQQAPPAAAAPAPAPAATPPAPPYWYYCESAKGYYPYVASCPGGWKQVPATPPDSPQP